MKIKFDHLTPRWFNQYLIDTHTDRLHEIYEKNKIDLGDNIRVRTVAIDYFTSIGIRVALDETNHLVFDLDDKDFLITMLKYSDPE
jgi:hypothetical protein